MLILRHTLLLSAAKRAVITTNARRITKKIAVPGPTAAAGAAVMAGSGGAGSEATAPKPASLAVTTTLPRHLKAAESARISGPARLVKSAGSPRPMKATRPARPTKVIVTTRSIKAAESARPVKAAESARPVKAAESARPVKAAESARPVKAAESARPVKAAESARPVKAAESARPVKATESARPVKAAESARPVKAAESARPVKAAESARPVKAAESARPVKAAESARPVKAAESARPVKAAESARPVKAAESARPVKAAESARPVKAAESARPVKAAESARPVKAAESARPVKAAESARPVKAAESARPVKAAESARPVKAAESARPVKAAESARPVKAAESARPVKAAESARPVKAAESARPVKAAESARPVKAASPSKTTKTVGSARSVKDTSPVVAAKAKGNAHARPSPRPTRSRSKASSAQPSTARSPPLQNEKIPIAPDHREKLLQIFQSLADINKALDEPYKASSYVIAVEKLKRNDYVYTNIPPNIMPPGVDDAKRKQLIAAVNATPSVGAKLKGKMVEILTTGDLAELHSLQAKPVIRAVRELTQVHGVGPRTAVTFFKKHGVKTVEELKQRVEEQEAAEGGKGNSREKPALQLTEAQRLGLKYHSDIKQRIPHEEVRLHEAYLKLRLRKYLGKGYELSICGSYRRRLPTSGDIDVLVTRKVKEDAQTPQHSPSGSGSNDKGNNSQDEKQLEPQEVLAAFVNALKEEGYIEATLAQGATKFMGVSRLKSYNYHGGGSSPEQYPARRLDIRFVEPECFPAALLYFTGSKNFNVIMRAEAIKRNFVLNEYGLFRNDMPPVSSSSSDPSGQKASSDKGLGENNDSSISRDRWSAEAFQKLVRAHYYSSKSHAFAGDTEEEEETGGETGHGKKKKSLTRKEKQQEKEIAALWREVEARRVKVKHERDIFAALGMAYVHPEQRET
uniref:Putative mitochondrial DNA polymerase beta-PAK n=1 Tax=Trypanosoma congolense (strain IL3000) TaxID=1068625 RepID=G0ULR5_TRYCI|nr:putative mitochondrial DNA polymerase beta-PAK [Trypanosoma congolense IL3000]